MKVRLSIVAGLLAGAAVGAIVFGGIVALAPDPPSPSATPSFAVESVAPSAAPSTLVSTSPGVSPGVSPDVSPGVSAATGPFHVGQAAPALVVPQVGGGTIDLATLRGKPVWIDFMATWCPSCQDELPLMSGFAARYAKAGLVVIAIDVREEEGAVAAFGERLAVIFPLGLDSDGTVAKAWDALALPVHFWIDAKGIVRDGARGGIGPDVMVNGLKKILPGVDVTP